MIDSSYAKLAQIHDIIKNSRQIEFNGKKTTTFFEKQNSIAGMFRDGFDINYKVPENSLFSQRNPEFTGYTLLHFSIMYKSKEAVDFLLMYYADVTCKALNGFTPLRLAFEEMKDFKITDNIKSQNLYVIINKLLSAHIYLNIKINPKCGNNISHFHIACLIDMQFANFFIKAGFDVNETISINSPLFPGFSPLHFAIRYGHAELVQKLLQRGARIDQADDKGRTPLQLLVDYNMQINDVLRVDTANSNRFKYNLKLQCLKKNDQIIEMLMAMTNSVDSHSSDDITFLHASCTGQNQDYVEKLLNGCTNINEPVKFDAPMWPGYTPLHFAARCNLNIFMLLLQKGANLIAKDAYNVTPLDLCTERYTPADISRILKVSSIGLIQLQENISLVDVFLNMDTNKKFKKFVSSIGSNVNVPLNSPVWPGYTLLHLSVLMSKMKKTYDPKYFVIKNCSWDQNVSLTFDNSDDISEVCLRKNRKMLFSKTIEINPLQLALHLGKGQNFCKRLLNIFSSYKSWSINKENLVYFIATDCPAIVQKLLKNRSYFNWTLQKNEIWYCNNDSQNIITLKAGSTLLHVAALAEANQVILEYLKCSVEISTLDDADGLSPAQLAFVNFKSKQTLFNLLLIPSAQKKNSMTRSKLSHLHIACYAGNIEAVEKLLQVISDVNEQIICDPSDPYHATLVNYIGNTPLHFAVQFGSMKIVSLLLKKGANVLQKNANGLNPLHLALLNVKARGIMRQIIKAAIGVKIFQDDFGITQLHLAYLIQDKNLIQKLLKDGVNINSQIHYDSPVYPGDTPHHLLVKSCLQAHTVPDLLLQNGIDFTIINSDNLTSLLLLHTDKVSFFQRGVYQNILFNQDINKFCTVNATNNEGLSHFHISCYLRQLTYVEKFLQSGADVNVPIDHFSNFWAGYTPLHIAARTENYELITLLLKYGANIMAEDKCGLTPVHHVMIKHPFSFIQNSTEAMTSMTKFDLYNCDTFGKSVFEKFMKHWDYNISSLGWMLDKYEGYVDVLKTPFDKMLKILCKRPISNMIQLLKEKGIDLSVEDSSGCNALFIVLSSFDEFNGSVNFNSSKYEWYLNNVEALVNAGRDIDHRDRDGRTSLHIAVSSSITATSVLLNMGADINIQDNLGQTPCKYAKKSTSRHLKSTLIQHHILQIAYAGLYLNTLNWNYFENILEQGPPASEAQILFELSQMKKEIIYEQLSVSDLLNEKLILSSSKFQEHKRRAILELLGGNELVKKYPGWRGLFRLQRRRILAREDLIKSAAKILKANTILSPLCANMVIEYLHNEDLKYLIEAFVK